MALLTRIAGVLCLALLMEGAAFAVMNRDVLWLRQSDTAVVANPEDFARYADLTLARRKPTRAQLESISRRANQLGMTTLEVRALRACVMLAPQDAHVRLRLADALRRDGALSEAERLYRGILQEPLAVSR